MNRDVRLLHLEDINGLRPPPHVVVAVPHKAANQLGHEESAEEVDALRTTNNRFSPFEKAHPHIDDLSR